MENKPEFKQIKNGWAAIGDGWAVHGTTQEEAQRLYDEAEKRHSVIDGRTSRESREVLTNKKKGRAREWNFISLTNRLR